MLSFYEIDIVLLWTGTWRVLTMDPGLMKIAVPVQAMHLKYIIRSLTKR
jgi:hypothetical protein